MVSKLMRRVTYDDLYPRALLNDDLTSGVFKSPDSGPCWVCRRPTTWVSLAFEAWVCSAVCDDLGWERFCRDAAREPVMSDNGTKRLERGFQMADPLGDLHHNDPDDHHTHLDKDGNPLAHSHPITVRRHTHTLTGVNYGLARYPRHSPHNPNRPEPDRPFVRGI